MLIYYKAVDLMTNAEISQVLKSVYFDWIFKSEISQAIVSYSCPRNEMDAELQRTSVNVQLSLLISIRRSVYIGFLLRLGLALFSLFGSFRS